MRFFKTDLAAEEPPRLGPKLMRAADSGVGRLVPDLNFTDLHGKRGKLSSYKSSKALVIALTGTTCPVSKRFTPALARLEKEFAGRGVVFLFVDPIATDLPADMKAQGFAGRYVHDKNDALVKAYGC